ncbi:MAG TPA: endo-1,4-beta-xylanase [Chitinispirillaceae bacterium]|nr:endo-1,4-beta-xylanase [Chitinispirillaceae bacterium]
MKNAFRKVVNVSLLALMTGLLSTSWGTLTQSFKDATDKAIDSLRRSECEISFKLNDNQVEDTGFSVSAKLIQHHFGFGASVCWDSGFVKIGKDKYGAAVKEYFEWCTPENELKWYYNDTTGGTPCAPGDYRDGDSIVQWCLSNGLKVRGHNLFWNERVEFQAYCARPYGPYHATDSSKEIKALTSDESDAFIGEMVTRITDMVTLFKGKVSHWDAVNEIVHFTTDNDGARVVKTPGLLATWTGKTKNSGAEVFNWILEMADSIDPAVKLCVNEYNVIERGHDENAYIDMIKAINNNAKNAKVDIIGLEGHFGDLVSREANGSYPGYESLINKIAQGVNLDQDTSMKFWFTEIDWNQSGNTADLMEELMRFSYSRKDFGGLLLWIWWQGRLWRDDLKSFLVDNDLKPTETGNRWKKLKDTLWTTDTMVKADDAGKCKFKGFQGTYLVTTKKGSASQIDTIEVLPGGVSKKTITLDPSKFSSVGVRHQKNRFAPMVQINGKIMSLQEFNGAPVQLSIYSLSGKLISRIPINTDSRTVQTIATPAGCHIYRFEAANKVILSEISVQLTR